MNDAAHPLAPERQNVENESARQIIDTRHIGCRGHAVCLFDSDLLLRVLARALLQLTTFAVWLKKNHKTRKTRCGHRR
ncbi:hypothetical protein ACFQE4_31125 [Streptomyces thermocoprophilus]|uniref:hypothetical protein n=1 Tax=Streptomyces thermocoprophilus TaxID=78356 RepID=UPI00360F8D34